MNINGVTTKYDSSLFQSEHYKKYPNMLPWVGRLYGEKHKKVLFIGESHYFPKESTRQLNDESWYSSTQSKLNASELSYINTRKALLDNYRRNGIWRIPAQLMLKNGISLPETSDNIYEHFCFYNFFQRPAQKEGKELYISDKDVEEANKIFQTNLSTLAPDIVIFLSSKSWGKANTHGSDISFHFTSHPSSPWWNRKSKKYALKGGSPLTGREKFIELVKYFRN